MKITAHGAVILCVVLASCTSSPTEGEGGDELLGSLEVVGTIEVETKGEWLYWANTPIGQFRLDVDAVSPSDTGKQVRIAANIVKIKYAMRYTKEEYNRLLAMSKTHQMRTPTELKNVKDGQKVEVSYVVLRNVRVNGQPLPSPKPYVSRDPLLHPPKEGEKVEDPFGGTQGDASVDQVQTK